MSSVTPLLVAAVTLAVGPSAVGAQETDEGMPLEAPHLYEVSSEHAALLQAARQAAEGARFIEVSGHGRVVVPADRARVVFSVETEGATAAAASGANAERMTAVLAAVRGLGLEGLEIETHGYSLHPDYERGRDEPMAPRIVGYRAMNHVAASIDAADAIGRVIDAAIGAGANRVASLSFEASDTDDARREALRRAVAHARVEAEAIAEALGVPLGAPIEVRGNADVPVPQPEYRMAMAMSAADTPVEPGQETVTASVTIKYLLEGGD